MARLKILLLLPLALAACTPTEEMRRSWAAAQVEAEVALAASTQRWQTRYAAGDWEGLRALYTDDAALMTQGQPRIDGADNIIAFLRRISDAGGTVQFQFDNEEVTAEAPYGAADYGTVTSKYLMTISYPDREPIVVTGRSLLIYRWDGEWKLWRDMDNAAPDVRPEDFE